MYQQNGLTLPDDFDASLLDPQAAVLLGQSAPTAAASDQTETPILVRHVTAAVMVRSVTPESAGSAQAETKAHRLKSRPITEHVSRSSAPGNCGRCPPGMQFANRATAFGWSNRRELHVIDARLLYGDRCTVSLLRFGTISRQLGVSGPRRIVQIRNSMRRHA